LFFENSAIVNLKHFTLMAFTNHFSHLGTNELVERFKAATLQGQPPKELVDEECEAT
jgi:hypothetical protein